MHLFFRRRTLHVHIVSVFLVLLALSSTIIILFSYARNKQAVLHLARENISHLGSTIEGNTRELLYDLSLLPQKAIGFYKRNPGISSDNKELVRYFLNLVRFYPHLYSFFAAQPNGDYLCAYNLDSIPKFQAPLPVPIGTLYASAMQLQEEKKENWSFYDSDMNLISSKEIPLGSFDPRSAPWYELAESSREMRWTHPYTLHASQSPGISVGTPLFDEAGKLSAVIGTDLPLQKLSEFFLEQKVGRAGKAFLVDHKGQILLPFSSEQAQPFVAAALGSVKKKDAEHVIFREQGARYLGSIHPFPVASNQEWSIVVIDPFADFFGDIFHVQVQAVVICILILLLTSLLVIHFSKEISHPIVALAKEVEKIQQLELDSSLRIPSLIIEVEQMDQAIAAMRAAIRSFSRYVPKEVVHQLIKDGQEIALGGKNEEVAIFFSDITDFTGISSQLTPEEINAMLKGYFAVLSNLILKNHGTIDKYMGDGVMAIWGMPEEIPNPALTACETALSAQKELAEFNHAQKIKGRPQLFTRIGINTGVALVGNIGTEDRMNYTAIGDVVNTTSHLQTLNKNYHTEIIIGEEAVGHVRAHCLIRPLDKLELKGKKGEVVVYELGGMVEGPLAASEEKKRLFTQFSVAYEEFREGRMDEARRRFSELCENYPDDSPSKLYLSRCV